MSQLPVPRVSASVGEVSSKKTNRVVLGRKRGVVYQSKTGVRPDPTVAGKPYTVIGVSIPFEHLDRIDHEASKRKMSRSAFLRFAALTFCTGAE